MKPNPRISSYVLFTLVAAALACAKKSDPPTAPPSPQCSLSATSMNFGSVAVGSSADRQVTLTNAGDGVLSGALTANCTGFLIAGSSDYVLSVGQSVIIAVRFSPPAEGAYRCTVSTGQAACIVACQGTGIPGPDTCAVSPATLDFGSVTVGQVLDRTFTVTNTGTRRLVGSLAESCPAFAIEGLTGYDLGPGQSETLTIRFHPSQAGIQSCTITASGCPAIMCTGTGVPVDPACQLSVSGLLFPQQALGTRSDATFELTNVGTSNLAGTVTESCPGFSIAGQASYDLGPGERQTFIVRFEPIYVGDHTCEVNVGAGCPPLSCWGSGVIGCSYQPEQIHFGYFRPGEIRCGSLTLKNNSSTLQTGNLSAQQIGWDTGTILLDGVTISGAGSSPPYSLNAGQSRTFTLCWRADLSVGQPTRCDTTLGEWRIRSSDEGCSDVFATIQGIVTSVASARSTPRRLISEAWPPARSDSRNCTAVFVVLSRHVSYPS